jgi:Protein of unknown function (DUF1573)
MPIILLLLFFNLNFIDSKIQWITPTSYDFGEIAKDQPKEFIFEFKNSTQQAVVIDNVRTECGCTATEWNKTPVEAGNLGQIKVTYDAFSTGYFKKKITVWIHGQKRAEKLYIEGEVVP